MTITKHNKHRKHNKHNKRTVKARGKETLKGFNVTLTLSPIVNYEDESHFYLETNRKNLKVIKAWYETIIQEQKVTYLIDDEEIKVIKDSDKYYIQIKFKVNKSENVEKDLAIQAVLKPDERMEYPLYIDEDKNIHANNKAGLKNVFIEGKKIKQNIRNIYKQNSN